MTLKGLLSYNIYYTGLLKVGHAPSKYYALLSIVYDRDISAANMRKHQRY